MLRRIFSRSRCLAAVLTVVGVSCLATSCGVGGVAANDMILLELQFLDRSLAPTAPTGTTSLPRNALIGMIFSELVDPDTVDSQTVQLRFGDSLQSVPSGSFRVNGNQIIFDPTVTAQGQPNPLGFLPVTQYILDIPGFEEQASVVKNLDDDPNLTTFFTEFTTSEGWLRELVPPEVEEIIWVPDVDPLTKDIPGNGIMGIVFDEAMDPSRFALKLSDISTPPEVTETVDVRFTDASINNTSQVAESPLFGSFTPSADLKTYFFKPMFSFGATKLVFTVQLFQGLTDLSGNLLVNPGSFGPFTCDGKGIVNGKVLTEDFFGMGDMDSAATDADWGSLEEGVLHGQPVTSRKAYLYSARETIDGSGGTSRGLYFPLDQPLMGQERNNFLPPPSPATSLGRRVMWSFSDVDVGAKGSITAVAWGPDSNATFAATHPNIKMRLGYQKTNSLTLSPSFSGNYEGQPALVYNGSYSIEQKANVGNVPGAPFTTPNTGGPAGLFAFTGWYDYPKLGTFFEWDPGDPLVNNDRVLIFDVSAAEADGFQQVRGWFGITANLLLIPGLPLTRMYSTYEDDEPNPLANFAAGIQNPEQSTSDTCFTITRRVSVAQSKFYIPGSGVNTTFGDATDYRPAIIAPMVQSGGAQVIVEYQGAGAVEADRVTLNQSAPFTDWVQDINDCDNMPNLRWRISLISNLISLATAKVKTVVVPMVDASP